MAVGRAVIMDTIGPSSPVLRGSLKSHASHGPGFVVCKAIITFLEIHLE